MHGFSPAGKPLVLSVHTVVSFDFAVAMFLRAHTIFPPYFVAARSTQDLRWCSLSLFATQSL